MPSVRTIIAWVLSALVIFFIAKFLIAHPGTATSAGSTLKGAMGWLSAFAGSL